jgi:hypothetical protein
MGNELLAIRSELFDDARTIKCVQQQAPVYPVFHLRSSQETLVTLISNLVFVIPCPLLFLARSWGIIRFMHSSRAV